MKKVLAKINEKIVIAKELKDKVLSEIGVIQVDCIKKIFR